MKLGRGEHKPVEKKGVAFSKSIVEIRKKQKDQKRVLMFPRLSAEKGNADDYHAIEKAKSKRPEEMELA